MAKGLARFGLLLALLFTQPGAHAATVGSLLISEVMANPAAVGDSRGEWFELFNPGAEAVNLRDITIGDDGRDHHRIETDLLILPGYYLTLARNGDPTLNGGFAAIMCIEISASVTPATKSCCATIRWNGCGSNTAPASR